MKIKSAVITGATGVVGSSIIDELILKGVKVLVLSRKSNRQSNIPKSDLVKVENVTLDELKDYDPKGKSYDAFFHLGWAGTTGAARNDYEMQQKNVEYCLDALYLAKKFNCKVFVGAGSQAEYGRVEGNLTPSTPTNPENQYGVAKLKAGKLVHKLGKELGINTVWVRILSMFGKENDNSMPMTTIDKIMNGQEPSFTKAEQLWDFIYCKDGAKAFVKAAESGKPGATYVLGSGVKRPLKEYILTISKIVNPQIKLHFGAIEYAPNQVMNLGADISSLKEDTGWQPEYSFEQAIKEIYSNLLQKQNTHN